MFSEMQSFPEMKDDDDDMTIAYIVLSVLYTLFSLIQ